MAGPQIIAVCNVPNTFTAAQGVAAFALTDAATIAVDASQSNSFSVTLGGNRTISNPIALVDGYTYVFAIKQDATGSRTVTWGSKFKWPGATAPTLSTGANKTDIFTFFCLGGNLLQPGLDVR
jgi:hypothetical protein